jgi:hypothetical protein
MTTSIAAPSLIEVVEAANKILDEVGTVAATSTSSNKHGFLKLTNKEGTRSIGIVHLLRFTGSPPFVYRTKDELVQAIVKRVNLYIQSEKEKRFYVDVNGTIFDFGKVKVERRIDNTFLVDGTQVTLKDNEPLLLTRIFSEGVVSFVKLENGHVQLRDEVDKREKKGIFINTEGRIYRA